MADSQSQKPTIDTRETLAALINDKKIEIMDIWRLKVRQIDSAKEMTDPVINDEIPKLLDEVVIELQTMENHAPKSQSAGKELQNLRPQAVNHGEERFKAGFSVTEVVREYSLLREIIGDVVEKGGPPLSGSCGRTVHRAINSAISIAVQSYTLEKAKELRKRREENISFIIHDLKTPLSAINLAAGVIEDTIVSDPAAAAEMLQLIIRNASRMDAMLQKIIEAEKALQSGIETKLAARELDLWPLVESVVEGMRSLAMDSNTEIVDLISHTATVFADAPSLTTIFQNLISNGLKYTSNGKIILSSKHHHDYTECTVKDTGDGIPAARLATLFTDREIDPNKKGSSGLGLSIVKKAVEAHGGKLKVESTLGEGTTFRFTLPRMQRNFEAER